MENTEQQISETKPGKKFSLKTKIGIVLLIVLLGVAVYGYFWFRSTQKIRMEAEAVLQQVEEYERLQEKIEAEKKRCETLILEEEGNFGSFEYCKRFLELF